MHHPRNRKRRRTPPSLSIRGLISPINTLKQGVVEWWVGGWVEETERLIFQQNWIEARLHTMLSF
jgi:hypothetical protein